MRQFHEAYPDPQIVTALLTQSPWTHNLIILSCSQRPEEREFYPLERPRPIDFAQPVTVTPSQKHRHRLSQQHFTNVLHYKETMLKFI
jgi:hypothetical protein